MGTVVLLGAGNPRGNQGGKNKGETPKGTGQPSPSHPSHPVHLLVLLHTAPESALFHQILWVLTREKEAKYAFHFQT